MSKVRHILISQSIAVCGCNLEGFNDLNIAIVSLEPTPAHTTLPVFPQTAADGASFILRWEPCTENTGSINWATVTGVTVGAGLSGGTIAGSDTISMPNSNFSC